MKTHLINNFISHIDKRHRNLCAEVIYDFLDNAKQICLKYHKVIEGFYLTDNMCYFAFNNTHLHELDDETPIYSVNSIDDENDWDMIELYGIIDIPQFQIITNLYLQYEDVFHLSHANVQLVKEHQFEIEQSL